MRKLKHRALRAGALQAIDDLKWIADNAQTIADRANAEIDDGLRARRYDGDGRGGSELTGPESHIDQHLMRDQQGNPIRTPAGNITLRPDATHEQITRFLGMLSLTVDNATTTRDLAGELITSHDLNDRQHQANVASTIGGRGHCENCSRWCEGTRNDRLITPTTSDTNRQGAIAQCPPCLVYWKRNGELRPPKLWNADELTGEQVNTETTRDAHP